MITHAVQYVHYFNILNQIPSHHQDRYYTRGFASHRNHALLEFHQVMVGSFARLLLQHDIIRNQIKPPQYIYDVLEKDCQTSRGYLSHNGARPEGQSLAEATDRGHVFYTNSQHTIALIPGLHTIYFAIQNNLTYRQAEIRQTQQQTISRML